jgi:aminoglycoside 3-N-acetyltransferase I
MTGEQLPNDNRYPNMLKIQTSRLTSDNRELAKGLFIMMAEVFAEGSDHLSDAYLDRLLSREDFWAIATVVGDEIVGGLTAHMLPMTRSESSEIFIYDLAVREDQQRKGIGRQLMTALREAAAAAGIQHVLVAADNDDGHALDFYRAVGGVPSPVTFFTFSGDMG